jgi:glycosyltransferase involved in cell wall biosynthesis
VDYSEYDQSVRGGKAAKIAGIFGKNRSEYLKSMMRWLKNGEHPGSIKYILSGHKKAIKNILKSASFVLANSQSELDRLYSDFSIDSESIIVPNATDLDELKIDSKREGVICVARIEGLKNQLNLIRAIKRTDLHLTIIGKASPNHKVYFKQCQNEANDQISFVDHIDQEDLRNFYSSAKVHAMVSWFETTGLSTLEAAACGCNVVISKKGDQPDYFKDHAFYADPANVENMKKAILEAYHSPVSDELMTEIKENYTWEKAATATYAAYQKALK